MYKPGRSLMWWCAALACCMGLAGCLAYPPYREARVSDDFSLLYAPHFKDGKFFNPWAPFEPSFKRRLQFMLTKNPYPRRKPVVPRVDNDGAYLSGYQAGAALTWIGHSTVAIHEGDDVVVTDPHLRNRIWGVRRLQPPGVPVTALPADTMVAISHAHLDHLSAGTVDDLPASVFYVVPLGLREWFVARGRENVVELDWWQSHQRGAWTFTCLPSQHWSQRIEVPFNQTLWCSWLIESGSRRYFFAGDTGYFHGFAEFGRRYPDIDVAILPIGAYAPRDFIGYQHMDPQQAYRAFEDLKARYLLAVHWGSFRLSHEPLDQGPIELRAHVKAVGGDARRVRLIAIGERWVLADD